MKSGRFGGIGGSAGPFALNGGVCFCVGRERVSARIPGGCAGGVF